MTYWKEIWNILLGRDKGNLKYSDNIDIIVPLISNLALTHYKSRRPSKLAKYSGLPIDHVQKVLDGFSSIFRKSTVQSKQNGEFYYTLHHRYALRRKHGGKGIQSRELNDSEINTLVDFVSYMAQSEKDRRSLWITGIATAFIPVLCAMIAAWAALYK